MHFLDFLKNIGHYLGRTFGIIKKIVPEQILERAIVLAKEAAFKYTENALRREWVVEELMKIPGMNESRARLLVELAVQHLKEDVIEAAADKAEKAVAGPLASGTSAVAGTQ